MLIRFWNWLIRRPKRWAHLQRIPGRQLLTLLAGVFLLFSVVGFYIDVISGGTMPWAIVLLFAVLSGLNAVAWMLVLARLPMYCLVLLIVIECFNGQLNSFASSLLRKTFHPAPMPAQAGLNFAGTAILLVAVASYGYFARYMRTTGMENFRIKNELELAHSIQKTLVPAIDHSTRCFEIYGFSQPSEKVGGDLVDAVRLSNGDTVAYLADIAGHGLQAGILMGMLKTASRMALTDETAVDGEILSKLMQQLNQVLPQVKEAHMYATFTGIRLNENGEAFYGMAASTPLLHWSAAGAIMAQIEEQQFPLGLLPVSGFSSKPLRMEPGDVVVVATDGILEVNATAKGSGGEEFGIAALADLVAEHWRMSLPELARLILQSVRQYGQQVDDQTLLLVRRRAV